MFDRLGLCGNGSIGELLGMPIVTSSHVPEGTAFVAGGSLFVRDMWRDVQLPMMLAKMRAELQEGLRAEVRKAEKRLGLEPCQHLRVTARRSEPRKRWEAVCSVCGEVRGWVSDEQVARLRFRRRLKQANEELTVTLAEQAEVMQRVTDGLEAFRFAWTGVVRPPKDVVRIVGLT